jgi:hypothetical protein
VLFEAVEGIRNASADFSPGPWRLWADTFCHDADPGDTLERSTPNNRLVTGLAAVVTLWVVCTVCFSPESRRGGFTPTNLCTMATAVVVSLLAGWYLSEVAQPCLSDLVETVVRAGSGPVALLASFQRNSQKSFLLLFFAGASLACMSFAVMVMAPGPWMFPQAAASLLQSSGHLSMSGLAHFGTLLPYQLATLASCGSQLAGVVLAAITTAYQWCTTATPEETEKVKRGPYALIAILVFAVLAMGATIFGCTWLSVPIWLSCLTFGSMLVVGSQDPDCGDLALDPLLMGQTWLIAYIGMNSAWADRNCFLWGLAVVLSCVNLAILTRLYRPLMEDLDEDTNRHLWYLYQGLLYGSLGCFWYFVELGQYGAQDTYMVSVLSVFSGLCFAWALCLWLWAWWYEADETAEDE